MSAREDSEQEKKVIKKSVYLSALFCTSFFFSICQQDSNSRVSKDGETVTKNIRQSIFARHLFSDLSLQQQSVCACRICVFFYAGSEKLHCVSLLAYANARGGCGRWGGAPPSSSREKGSFAANQKELQKPILTCSSKDAEEFLLLLNAGLCFPRMKNTARLMLLSV